MCFYKRVKDAVFTMIDGVLIKGLAKQVDYRVETGMILQLAFFEDCVGSIEQICGHFSRVKLVVPLLKLK